jgi:FkbM family methyltransferase
MAFVLHALREDDLFVDVGANVGTYTMLAAGVTGCRCVAIEPAGRSYEQLIDNLRLNQVQHRVDAHRVAAGRERGNVRITQDRDSMNHIIHADKGAAGSSAAVVAVRTLDDILADLSPTIIKIDVEGYEPHVIAGALKTLRRSSLLAVLMETNRDVGSEEDRVSADGQMQALGFSRYRYRGELRRLHRVGAADLNDANTIYARSEDALLERIRGARRFRVLDTEI